MTLWQTNVTMGATWQFRNGIDMALVPLPAGLGVPKRRLEFGAFDAWPKSATWQFRNGIDMALVPLHAGLGVPKTGLERLMPATWQFRNGIDMALVPLRLERLMPATRQ